MSVYVVCSIDYDYNDEYYYTNGEDSGSPIKVFTDRERAEDECERKNVEEFFRSYNWNNSGCVNPIEYSDEGWYGLDVDYDDLRVNLTTLIGHANWVDEYSLQIPKDEVENLTDHQKKEIVRLCNLHFYKVVEVESDTATGVGCAHEPDWENVGIRGLAQGVIDIPCKVCGDVGAVTIELDDINWDYNNPTKFKI